MAGDKPLRQIPQIFGLGTVSPRKCPKTERLLENPHASTVRFERHFSTMLTNSRFLLDLEVFGDGRIRVLGLLSEISRQENPFAGVLAAGTLLILHKSSFCRPVFRLPIATAVFTSFSGSTQC